MSADDLLAALTGAEALRAEVNRLRAIEAWAIAQQPFTVGDAVVIRDAPVITLAGSWGWWPFREFLVNGCTGVVTEVHFNRWSERWGLTFKPDVQWIALSDGGRRPENRPATFAFTPERLRKRKKRDTPLALPADVASQINGSAS